MSLRWRLGVVEKHMEEGDQSVDTDEEGRTRLRCREQDDTDGDYPLDVNVETVLFDRECFL